MIKYAKILKPKEKDNPSPFCRASYLFSNVGTLVYCYGRIMRFTSLENAYMAEIKLALGDIIMQAMMLLEDNKLRPMENTNLDRYSWGDNKEETIRLIATNASWLLNSDRNKMTIGNISQYTRELLLWCAISCAQFGWNFEEVSHLGFQHVMERFEQFAKEGWE